MQGLEFFTLGNINLTYNTSDDDKLVKKLDFNFKDLDPVTLFNYANKKDNEIPSEFKFCKLLKDKTLEEIENFTKINSTNQ